MPSRAPFEEADFVVSLQAYYRSGWTFLLPYLVLYLLYAALGWPVNASAHVPSLLSVYWTVHAIHALGAGVAFWSWRKIPNSAGAPERLRQFLPWVLLALFLLLPGIYWEYPSDNWEHYHRINAWADSNTVLGNGDWEKSGYFLAYSFCRLFAPGDLGLEFYYTGTVMLLCWQYHRLARLAGLRPPAAFLTAVLPVLFAGNGIFALHRYYGISSTLLAQLAAVAFVRVCAEPPPSPRTSTWAHVRTAQAGLLLLLMAFEHKQALAFALVGLMSIIGWRLCAWRSAAKWWLLAAALGLSIIVVTWRMPRAESIAFLRAGGWFTFFGSFNLVPGSPAFAQGMQVLGWFGVLNVIAGCALLRNNHLAGWLTVAPVAALLLPVTALPLAEYLFHLSTFHIPAFSRLFLCIPAGFALVAWLDQPAAARKISPGAMRLLVPGALPFALALLLVLPAGAPTFNRFWHATMVPPEDLTLRTVPADFSMLEVKKMRDRSGWFMTRPAAGFVAMAAGQPPVLIHGQRLIQYPAWTPPAVFVARDQAELLADRSRPMLVFVPASRTLFSPASQAAHLSGHWLPAEVALNTAGEAETNAGAAALMIDRLIQPAGTYYLLGPR